MGSLVVLWFAHHLPAGLSVVFPVKAQSIQLLIRKPNFQRTGESNLTFTLLPFCIDGSWSITEIHHRKVTQNKLCLFMMKTDSLILIPTKSIKIFLYVLAFLSKWQNTQRTKQDSCNQHFLKTCIRTLVVQFDVELRFEEKTEKTTCP